MKNDVFDAMTTAVTGMQNRRQALRMLGGLSLAGLLGVTEAAAKAKKHAGAKHGHGRVEAARKGKKKKGKGKHHGGHHGGGNGGGGGGGTTVPPQPGFTVSGRQILTPGWEPGLAAWGQQDVPL